MKANPWTRTNPERTPEFLSVEVEHAVLLRRVAALQKRWGEQWHQQQTQVRELEAEVVRLRAQLLKERTALYWGLKPRPVPAPALQGPATASIRRQTATEHAAEPGAARSMYQADAVICQTGCTGHAHPWRSDGGLCRRSGEPCHSAAGLPKALEE